MVSFWVGLPAPTSGHYQLIIMLTLMIDPPNYPLGWSYLPKRVANAIQVGR